VEHRIARLVQLGIRQARNVGRTKTLFQVCLVAAVANLRSSPRPPTRYRTAIRIVSLSRSSCW
jgi:hypothetical protein